MVSPAILSRHGVRSYSDGFDGSSLNPAWKHNGTWSVAGGVAVNTPGLKAELLTDPGLEGTYTGGLNVNLGTAGSAPTNTQSADVHGGAKAQQFVGGGANSQDRTPAFTPSGFYYYITAWFKRAAGSNSNVTMMIQQTGGITLNSPAVVSGAYAQNFVTLPIIGTDLLYAAWAYQLNASASDTIIFDDISIKEIVHSNIFCAMRFLSSNIDISIKFTGQQSTMGGIVLCLDSISNPQNYILCMHDRYQGVRILKMVSGILTQVSSASVTYAAAGVVRVWKQGSTLKVYYNGALQLTSTVDNASVLNNKLHGIFSLSPIVNLDDFVAIPTL